MLSYRAPRRYAALACLGVTLASSLSLPVATGQPPAQPARFTAERDQPAHGALTDGHRAHDLHLTYSRVEVDGTSIRWRVRLFRDDLEKALRTSTRRPSLSAALPAGDSAFTNYFNAHVRVSALGSRLTGTVIESGRDAESSDAEMWWYLVELRAPAPIRSLSINVSLLFDHFADQRNVVNIGPDTGGARRSLYFAKGDREERTVVF